MTLDLVYRLGIAVGALAAAGCADSIVPTAGSTTRDSAGVEIVESDAPLAERRWRVSREPTLEISDEALFRVHAVVRLPGGGVAVANRGSLEVRIYDADGELLAAAGGEGEGPGELRGMSGLVPVDGNLLLFDPALNRVTEYASDGALIGSVQLDDADVMNQLLGALDTVLVFRTAVRMQALRDRDIYWHTAPNRAYTRDGRSLGEFADPAGMHISVKDQRVDFPLFGRRSSTGVGAGWFYLGHGERYDLEGYDITGALRRVVRKRVEPVPTTDADIEEYVAARLASIEDEGRRRRIVEAIDRAEALPTKPAYTDLRVGTTGELWVEEWRVPWTEEAERWSVFSEDGRWLTVLDLPPRFRLMEAGSDYALGVWRDELDVEHVRVYDLVRNSTSDGD